MFALSVHFTKRTFIHTLAWSVVLFSALCSTVFAAEVVVSPSTGSYGVGQTFTATIQVNPQAKSVNAVEAKFTFDATKLSVQSISKTGSVFSLWTTEPTFSNSAGTIEFGGGSPTPFTAKSNLVTVTFKTLAAGDGKLSVGSASVLAADGLGTNVYTGGAGGTYTVTQAVTPPPPAQEDEEPAPAPEEEEESEAAITFGEPPRAPEAGSTVFLDPDTWYATKNGLFTWETPFDIDELALDVSTSSEWTPLTKYKPPIDEIALNDTLLDDGIQYLTLQYRNQVGWGAILHRKIMIDTIPPEKFTINVRAGNSPTAFPLLTFDAKDTISGVERYELTIADGEPVPITPDEAKLGYLLTNLVDGTYTVRVTAYDLAGNTTEASVPLLITSGWTPPLEVVDESSIWDIFTGKNLLILLLILAIIGLIGYVVSLKKFFEHKEQKLRKETKEIQDQMEKIFSALRDEIYDQINMITKKERLSKKEREAVEGLNQALEVSETLIEKEITDVSKILK